MNPKPVSLSKKQAKKQAKKEKVYPPKPTGKPKTNGEIRSRKNFGERFARYNEDIGAVKMLRAAGGHGVDSRSPKLVVTKNGVSSQFVKTQNSTIQVEAYCDYHSIWFLALAPIQLAIQRGWLSAETGIGGANTAYQAWCYLIQAYYNSMTGGTMAIQDSPKWFWETSAALSPESAKFKTGSVHYKWNFTPAFPSQKELYVNQYSLYFGSPTGSITNGFPELGPVNLYDPQVGEASLASLYQFMNSSGMAEVVADLDVKYMQQDASAFAAVYAEWGMANGGSGGVATTIQNEVKICCPIMAKFAQYQQANGIWRGFQDSRKSSGSASYIIPRALEFMSENDFKNKAPPIFKYYNFDEYFLTLSYILGLASELSAKDLTVTEVPVCPLTSWQVQVILRQALINRFCNIYAQDLNPETIIGTSFVPFCACVNGNSTTATQSMKFPFVFLENVRSATRRTINVGGKYVVDTLPILARPGDLPPIGNFTYIGKGGAVQFLYADDPAEVPVSLIDFSFNNYTQFITVTGAPLSTLISLWNDYITSLENNLTSLGTLGEEPGISALLTTFNTRHITSNPPDAVLVPKPAPVALPTLQKRASMNKIQGSKIPERKKLGAPEPVSGPSSQYKSYSALFLTSTDPFYSSLWRYTSAFVQPCSFAGFLSFYDSSLAFQQVFQVEPYKYPYSDLPQNGPNANLVSIDEISFNAATLDVKTSLASSSEAELELTELAKTGRGGFFTSLAGMIGEGLGIPGAREVANTVGALTGL